jgi:hypothetical protein
VVKLIDQCGQDGNPAVKQRRDRRLMPPRLLNGMLGVVFGVVYLRHGIFCAVLAHFGTDVIWHTASQLLRAQGSTEAGSARV